MKIEERALRNARRQELEPLLNEIERLVKAGGGGLGLDHVTRKLLVRGLNGERLTHALPFIKWMSSLPEWVGRGLKIDPPGIILFRDSELLIEQLADRIEQFCYEEADEVIDEKQWSVSVEVLIGRINQWCIQNPHYRIDSVQFSIDMLDKTLGKLAGRLKRQENKVYSLELWEKRRVEDGLALAAVNFIDQFKKVMDC